MNKEKLRTVFNKRIKKLDIDIPAKDELFERFAELYNHGGFECAYCGKRMELKWGDTELSFTIDHILARSHGGSDRVHNLTFACQSCNSMKGNKDAGWFANNVKRAREKKLKREMWKARKASKKDEKLRESYKEIFQHVKAQ